MLPLMYFGVFDIYGNLIKTDNSSQLVLEFDNSGEAY